MPDLSFLPKFVGVTPQLLTSGQPAPTDFTRLKELGVNVVINLAAPGATNYLLEEAQLVIESGMTYIHLPVVWKAPQISDFETFAAVLEAQGDKTVLVHCAMNMRVSAFIYAYRVRFMGESEAVARERMERIWSPDGIWAELLAQITSIQST